MTLSSRLSRACALAAIAAIAGLGLLIGSEASSGASARSAGATSLPSPVSLARQFLRDYATNDGRILRRDQGSDIVSEGQAYGMILAEVAGQPATARTIWSWTHAHLQRSDRLMSFHASSSGKVLDTQPASDADVLMAWALLRYRGVDATALHADGREIANAVLAQETVTAPDGTTLLTAGPWATGSPAALDPSYWMPPIFVALARETGDNQWKTLAADSVRTLRAITRDGQELPPDWARLDGNAARPQRAPDGSAPHIQYGLDAQRVPAWFATACTPSARALAADWWSTLRTPSRQPDIALSLDGTVISSLRNPLGYVAASASAQAAGHSSTERSLLGAAGKQAKSYATYYGNAWVALGQALLGHTLGLCRS
jgi:endoglucanase